MSFIPRDDFFEGDDGCYTIEITVVHTPPFGDDITGVSSQGWKFWWDYNENRDTQPNDENNDGDIDPATEGTEPYKSPETC